MTFKQLADSWLERFPHSQSKWIQALCNQVRAGATWNFPTTSWDLMQGFNDSIWRAPVLTRVRKIPSRQCTQFDIYFFKFDLDAVNDSINIPIPTSTKKKKVRKAAKGSQASKKRAGKNLTKGKKQKVQQTAKKSRTQVRSRGKKTSKKRKS